MNIIIFGGAFDPIHNGHLNMASQASKQFDADVYFVPAKMSVWKKDSAPIEDKINMLKLAINGNPKFHIDTFEAESDKEICYSIDTVKYFKEKYPEAKLFYLIGEDHVNVFEKWKEAKELSNLAQIIFYQRSEEIENQKNIKEYNMLPVKGEIINVSSTDIKNFKNVEMPLSVIEYIEDHELYYISKIKAYFPNDEKRFKHSLSVANVALQIAIKHNLENPSKYYIVGCLHDIGKRVEKDGIMDKYFSEYKSIGEFAYHQFVGSYIAKIDFEIEDESMLNAIKYHATGCGIMDTLAKVIYASDKIDPRRSYDSSDLIKAMMELPIEEGFKVVLNANRDFLISKNKSYDNPLTVDCFNNYLK